MRRRFSVKGVDEDDLALLAEIREEERRMTGAIIGDCIRNYHTLLFGLDEEEDEEAVRSA